MHPANTPYTSSPALLTDPPCIMQPTWIYKPATSITAGAGVAAV